MHVHPYQTRAPAPASAETVSCKSETSALSTPEETVINQLTIRPHREGIWVPFRESLLWCLNLATLEGAIRVLKK